MCFVQYVSLQASMHCCRCYYYSDMCKLQFKKKLMKKEKCIFHNFFSSSLFFHLLYFKCIFCWFFERIFQITICENVRFFLHFYNTLGLSVRILCAMCINTFDRGLQFDWSIDFPMNWTFLKCGIGRSRLVNLPNAKFRIYFGDHNGHLYVYRVQK